MRYVNSLSTLTLTLIVVRDLRCLGPLTPNKNIILLEGGQRQIDKKISQDIIL